MRGREPRRPIRYDRESVYGAYVAFMREICEVHGHTPSTVICTPAATCEARAAITKSEQRNAVLHFAHKPFGRRRKMNSFIFYIDRCCRQSRSGNPALDSAASGPDPDPDRVRIPDPDYGADFDSGPVSFSTLIQTQISILPLVPLPLEIRTNQRTIPCERAIEEKRHSNTQPPTAPAQGPKPHAIAPCHRGAEYVIIPLCNIKDEIRRTANKTERARESRYGPASNSLFS
ncbi:hypothetical protein EVAR_5539_1 [Eumeta japonica]|uniref:Uncharacterized protein n=1 Tax=Eumeta variegata TaxID=151549 RepID=A0A4C1TC16_EUMVA|nr:hypothetical protein EVAR_5539_1 [Eumeta japonica]